ncbi:MAG: hypothetical protein A3F35_02485 [Candidatus Woykebacteria bacterium RIFCSPHIGHO2_12_FULL_45_10]|uniref:Uncharacterized protein n=1 Tax=Candidatus Woykebacteria bacterium RIFCSPHIGHO2_12_FULL_45_10 TaxID=1802603 RepID=A0A1G1WQ58_9BACT|nr:MAG: hypothetical protein A3F35_02485 [Candidatus Woykebacteria bacterium RIFCSPHIGHO2_12_FULL_45_10]
MTLQDYINLTQNSINNFFSSLGPVLANIVAFVVILVIGLVIGAILKRVWVEILRAINLERSLSSWSTYQNLVKAHENLDATSFIGEFLRWLAVVVFLLPAVTALGVSGSDEILAKLLSYLPNVVLASVFLILGFVFSWVAHRVVMTVALLVDHNPAHLIADIAGLGVIIFASVEALLQLGLPADLLRFLILGGIVALTLAFGLAGKEQAATLVKKFVDQANK